MKEKQRAGKIKHISDNRCITVWKKAAHRVSSIRPIYWLLIAALFLSLLLIFTPFAVWDVLWKAVRAQAYLIGMLAILSLLAISLIWKTWQRFDVWIFRLINNRGRRPSWLDRLMLVFTQIGNGVFAYAVALIAFLNAEHLFAYELVFGNLTLWLTVEILKVSIRRPRPYSTLAEIRVIGVKERGSSFPSGHTSQAFFMASLLSHFLQTGIGVTLILYSIALLVGATRMYVGMHYPRDVFGGALLGSTWGVLGVIINSYIFTKLNLH